MPVFYLEYSETPDLLKRGQEDSQNVPQMQKHISLSARQMMKARGLNVIVDGVLQEIEARRSLLSRIRKVEVEWEKDPEVEGWEMLSVTLWAEGSPEDARNLWRELDGAMNSLRQNLSEADLAKMDRFVSVGADVE